MQRRFAFKKDRGEDKICSGSYDMLESNKCGSLTKTMMYLMQMQIAYCYIESTLCFCFPHHSLLFSGEYMLLEDVLYGPNPCCVLFFIVLSYDEKKNKK